MMKNLFIIPLLFFTIINGNVINTDNISRIVYDERGRGSRILFLEGSRVGQYYNYLLVENKTPKQVLIMILKNRIKI